MNQLRALISELENEYAENITRKGTGKHMLQVLQVIERARAILGKAHELEDHTLVRRLKECANKELPEIAQVIEQIRVQDILEIAQLTERIRGAYDAASELRNHPVVVRLRAEKAMLSLRPSNRNSDKSIKKPS